MSQKRGDFIALLKATFAVAVWGASFIATKIALRDISPFTLIWLRFGIGILILGVFVYARREFSLISKKELGYFSLLGFLGITFHQWLQSNGLITAQAVTTAWIITTIPIFIAILGRFVLKEKLGWIRLSGIAVAAFGVILVVTKGDLQSAVHGKFGSFGDLLILISAPNWAVFSVLSRRALKSYSSTNAMLYVMTLGWIFISPFFFIQSGFNEIAAITLNGWLSILFLGIFCSGFAYIFWYDALKAITASRVGSLLYIEPIVAVIVAAILLNEPILLVAIIGGVLIMFGVWLVNRPKDQD